MSFRTSKTVRARALAGLITAVELEYIEARANRSCGVRNDALRIARKALMKSWSMLHSDLGDPFEFKMNWDIREEANVRVHAKVEKYTDRIISDISPAIESLMIALQPTASVINPTINARYEVSMV